MTDNVENLVLELLRAMRGDIALVRDDIREIKMRMSSLENVVSSIKRDVADLYGEVSAQNTRYDRLTDRIERIERRLDIG
ncbi:hypothetical protein CKO09_02865 [Chromatium weissei]|nr:hypothetical protein [Chromatium weissei]